jgi:hypothetical protein
MRMLRGVLFVGQCCMLRCFIGSLYRFPALSMYAYLSMLIIVQRRNRRNNDVRYTSSLQFINLVNLFRNGV